MKAGERIYQALLSLAIGLGVIFIIAVLSGVFSRANAQERVDIPPQAAMYRLWVEQAASEQWGVSAPTARLAAQLHQESLWQARAKSRVGAIGIAQFMPATAKWIAERFPDQLGQFDPWDPRQSIRGAAIYDRWLYDRVRPMAGGLDACSRWAFTLRGYNGGAGWVSRERKLADRAGDDPDNWLAVEAHNARAGWAHHENTRYPRRILLVLEPAYIAAGWAGKAVCP